MRALTFISIVFLGSAVTALPLTTSMPPRLIIYEYLTNKRHVAEANAAVVKRQCGPPRWARTLMNAVFRSPTLKDKYSV